MPHDQGSSWGFLCLANVHQPKLAPTRHRGFPNLPSLPSALSAEICVASALLRFAECPCLSQANFGSTIRAIAQMKPTSSRATATIAVGADLPRAIRKR